MTHFMLAIDGGGVRGIFPATILARVEQEYGIKCSERFELIGGTSTGSIVAGALAIDYPINDVVTLYEERVTEIFTKKRFTVNGLIKSRYDRQYLENLLKLVLGSRTLSQTITHLVIPATDIRNGVPHVFKSAYSAEFVRDPQVKIVDAIVASCTAPSYFDPKRLDQGEYLLADGGLWANNPSRVVLIEALTRFQLDVTKVKILSIGTGSQAIRYGEDYDSKPPNWGLFSSWQGPKLASLVLNLQATNATNQTRLLLGDNYLRLNYDSVKPVQLDNPKILSEVKNWADYTFTHNSEKLKAFLEL